MSWGILDSGSSVGSQMERLCSVVPMVAGVDSVGAGRQTAGTAITNVPCSFQPMSSGASMQYKAENATNFYDLFLPTRLEGSATALTIPVGTRFVVDGVTYRSVGAGVRQGTSGIQKVGIVELNP